MSKRSSFRGVALLVVLALVGGGVWWWQGRETKRGESGGGASGSSARLPGTGEGTGTGAGTGQKRARLEGRVRGPGDAALPAIIHLDPGDGEPTTLVAGGDGRFVVEDLEPGAYAVSASAPGYVPDVEPELALRAGETTKVDLVLDRGGLTLRGTVTDALTGPIAGAVVSAATHDGFFGTRADSAAAMTDDAGRYTLTLAPGAYRVAASHAEYVGAGAQIELRDAEVVQDFRLVPGGVIEGIVKDEVTGQPVGGATVTVERERGGGRGWSEGRGVVTVESDAKGAFRAPGLMPGTLRLRAEVARDGRLSREPVLVPLGVAEQAANVEVFVGAAPFVAGRVVDEDGQAVAGAMVMAMGKQQLTSSESDGEGNFRFVGLQPGAWQLSASSEHHEADGTTPVTLADQAVEGVVVKVASAPHITGRVEPAAVAEVKLERDLTQGGIMLWGGGMAMMASTETNAQGVFDLTPVASGKRVVIAKTADGRRGKVEVDVPARGSVDVVIELEERGSIAGRVVDQRGNPVPGAAVHVKKLEGNKRSTFVVNGVDLTADRAVVARDGAFVMKGLDAGKYELTVADERGGRLGWARATKGKERAPVAVQLAENEQKTGVELTVELDDGILRGVVRNPDGTARAEAWVTASLRHDELMPERGGGPGGDGPEETSTTIMIVDDGSGVGGTPPVLTDESGRFELRGLRRGTYDLVAEAERGALRGRVENVRTGSDTAIALAGLASIEGVVTAGGKPVAEFSFEIEGLARRAQTVRDASGRFRIERIDPGTYTVRIKSAAGVGNGKVVAEAGKTAQVAITLAGPTRVVGRLVDDQGAPVASTPVLAMPARARDDEHGTFSFEGTPPTSGPDGRFDFEVEAGDYELIILGGPSRPVSPNKKFTAVSGQTADLGDIVVAAEAPPPVNP